MCCVRERLRPSRADSVDHMMIPIIPDFAHAATVKITASSRTIHCPISATRYRTKLPKTRAVLLNILTPFLAQTVIAWNQRIDLP